MTTWADEIRKANSDAGLNTQIVSMQDLKFLDSRKHTPRTKQIFWCNHCDAKQVDSNKPETGRFFVVFGHSWSQSHKEYEGEYTGGMFALCEDCLK